MKFYKKEVVQMIQNLSINIARFYTSISKENSAALAIVTPWIIISIFLAVFFIIKSFKTKNKNRRNYYFLDIIFYLLLLVSSIAVFISLSLYSISLLPNVLIPSTCILVPYSIYMGIRKVFLNKQHKKDTK